ncbi:MAG: class I SAM-dependent methyltransferase [Vicinamibacterales bacterium]
MVGRACLVLSIVVIALSLPVRAQQVYQPTVGQAGKDVVWVPTSLELIEKMLDLANVTRDDFVIDLGSGDGRNVIAAARRGARGLGVEFNPDMVGLSKRLAAEAGVSQLATFVEGDMYEADISQATVMALFLLPANMNRLEPKFLDLKPGSRIVANTFGFDGWEPDVREELQSTDCSSWCNALLWIVPAKVGGTWTMPEGTLSLQQSYQIVNGTLSMKGGKVELANARLRGEQIQFVAGGLSYVGRVTGDTMEGTVTAPDGTKPWIATRRNPSRQP